MTAAPILDPRDDPRNHPPDPDADGLIPAPAATRAEIANALRAAGVEPFRRPPEGWPGADPR